METAYCLSACRRGCEMLVQTKFRSPYVVGSKGKGSELISSHFFSCLKQQKWVSESAECGFSLQG